MDLLSPVGDFESLKAAVQNGADSVYFGSNMFSSRAFASNFDIEELKKAIEYAKIRGVKTNLTLNTLIKDSEYNLALDLAKNAYQFGIDAIIVQDLGLATKLIELFPDLPIHASTQMTVHNLNGALESEKLGFKRVVLARELSLNEIEYISKNSNIEIECFAHGALCISYSGQCLFSSMIGGRSGNRGKCAQPCRLPYELLEDDKKIDSGYLLSTRDLCSLEYIPSLLSAGVDCLKIEGRMKSATYVATTTKIYRKYIDLALSNEPYKIDEKDKKELMQVFNRGMSSSGHLDNKPNRKLVYKEKPNNMGLYLGIVQKFNESKGLITLKLREPISLGDTISLEKETGSYTISELMIDNKNVTETKVGNLVTIGRMKGNINLGDKIYKISSKELTLRAKESYKKEYKKIPLNCSITIKQNKPITIQVSSNSRDTIYKNLKFSYTSDFIPEIAKNKPLTEETVITQFSKTQSTPYTFQNIKIDLDNNVFIPKLSIINELRRVVLEKVENYALMNMRRSYTSPIKNDNSNSTISNMRTFVKEHSSTSKYKIPEISVLLNILKLDFDYSKLDGFNNLYIPLKYFTNRKYSKILTLLGEKFDLYIYMPTIVKANYKNLLYTHAENAITNYDIKGFVISNLCNIELLNDLFSDLDKYFKVVANYTFNVFNSKTVLELKKLGVNRFTISPELEKQSIIDLCSYQYLQKELIIYGKIPVLNMNYCLLRRNR